MLNLKELRLLITFTLCNMWSKISSILQNQKNINDLEPKFQMIVEQIAFVIKLIFYI